MCKQQMAYRKIISCTNVNKIKSLGKYLFKTKCKWENKVGGGDTTPPEGSWKSKPRLSVEIARELY
jgi:hypothetical protein